VKIIKNGQPAELSDFHTGDQLSATIVTEKPPRVVTEKAVNATTARSAPSDAAASSAPAKSSASASSQPAAGTAGTSAPAHKLPKTASPLPLVALAGIASLAIALALGARRRSAAR